MDNPGVSLWNLRLKNRKKKQSKQACTLGNKKGQNTTYDEGIVASTVLLLPISPVAFPMGSEVTGEMTSEHPSRDA